MSALMRLIGASAVPLQELAGHEDYDTPLEYMPIADRLAEVNRL